MRLAFAPKKLIDALAYPMPEIENSEDGRTIRASGLPVNVVLASVLSTLFGLAMPLTVLHVYDRVLPNHATDTLTVLIIGLVIVLMMDSLLKITRSFVVAWSAAVFTQNADVEAIRRIVYSSNKVLNQVAVAEHLDRLRALQSLGDFHGGPSRLLVLDLFASAFFLTVMFLIGGPVGFVPLFLFAIFAYRTYRRNVSLKELIERRSTQDNRKYDFVMEALEGIRTVKAMAMEPLIQRRFERLQKQSAQLGYEFNELSAKGQNASNLFTTLSTLCVVSVGALLTIEGYQSLGSVAACTLLAGQVIQPLLRGINYWTELQRIRHECASAVRLFDLPCAQTPSSLAVAQDGSVDVEGLLYSSGDGGTAVLSGIDLHVCNGETIGFRKTERNAATTLMQILNGRLEPQSGRVEISGHDLFGEASAALRKDIAYVGSEPQMFNGTVLDNLTMFGSRCEIDAARSAAQLIGLERELNLLPNGYDTKLSEGLSESLPVSTVQRIAIARALASEPKILILDNANACLDHPAEAALIEALRRLKSHLTILIVSHRPSFLALSDRQFLIQNGQIRSEDEEKALPRVEADAS